MNTAGRRRIAKLLGSRGGKATARKLTPEERSESARKAVTERWRRYRENQKKERTR